MTTPEKTPLAVRLRRLFVQLYTGELVLGRLPRALFNALKVFVAAARRFVHDEGFTKAASLAYTAIISLIPTLTVALTFYSIFAGIGDRQDEIFRTIANTLQEHNINVDVKPFFDALGSLIRNAGSIGGIGLVVLVFSATAVLRTLEESLNSIWRVKETRSLLRRLTYYWAVLTLGPILFIAGTAIATRLSERLAAPHVRSAALAPDGSLFVVGGRGLLGRLDRERLRPLSEDLVEGVEVPVFEYDEAAGGFVPADTRAERPDPDAAEFRRIRFFERRGWVTGTRGWLLGSVDGGSNWSARRLGEAALTDIVFLDAVHGFLAAEDGRLYGTTNGGTDWHSVAIPPVPEGIHALALIGRRGVIAAGGRGTLLASRDGGESWQLRRLREEGGAGERLPAVTALASADGRTVWAVGGDGSVHLSQDGGESWRERLGADNRYHALLALAGGHCLLVGDGSQSLKTIDYGENWIKRRVPGSTKRALLADGGIVWAFGDNALVARSDDEGMLWESREGRSFLGLAFNFLAPFALIWLLFLFTYTVIPNRRVPFGPAVLGAAFTAAVWVVFLLVFIVYIQSFAQGTFTIYGALAAIPLSLLLVYASSLIVFFGAEVSWVLVHPASYATLKRVFETGHPERQAFVLLALLLHAHQRQREGREAVPLRELEKLASRFGEDPVGPLGLLLEHGYLAAVEGQERVLPALPADRVRVAEVLALAGGAGFAVPEGLPAETPLGRFARELGPRVEQAVREVVGEWTLLDLLEEPPL